MPTSDKHRSEGSERAANVGAESGAGRFFRAAQVCRAHDLRQLGVLVELVQGISRLIHALQKERGSTAIFLGSGGKAFADRLAECVAESRKLETLVRERLERIDEHSERLTGGARFYTRVGFALLGLDHLPAARTQIHTLQLEPASALNSFSDLIGQLLAVGLEAADIAAEPHTSRALVALMNFSQGKEYAGQERAIAGAAFSIGHIEPQGQQRLRYLIDAQQRAFRTFAEFADPQRVVSFKELSAAAESGELQTMRQIVLGRSALGGAGFAATASRWYEVTTRRIDSMKHVEDALAADLGGLCASALAQAQARAQTGDLEPPGYPMAHVDGIRATAAVAMLITDVDPSRNPLGLEGGTGFYGVDEALPRPMRSIIEVVEAQSRRIDDMTTQLESARAALGQRKTIERAKGILMSSRGISDADAYALMRRTAMGQNKRLIEIAESILSMADLLKG